MLSENTNSTSPTVNPETDSSIHGQNPKTLIAEKKEHNYLTIYSDNGKQIKIDLNEENKTLQDDMTNVINKIEAVPCKTEPFEKTLNQRLERNKQILKYKK